MDFNYPQIANRLFHQPLLVHPDRARELVGALATRFLGGAPAKGRPPTDPEPDQRPQLSLNIPAGMARQTAEGVPVTSDGIAVIGVYGTLIRRAMAIDAMSGVVDYGKIARRLEDAATDPKVRGILLDIDSPGGEASGAFDLAALVRQVAEMKPTYAVADDAAYSAAYAIAAGAEHLVVSQTGGVGSIGVIAVHVDESEALEQEGLNVTVFRAGKYKAEHNSLEPLSDHARQSLQAELDRINDLFVAQVAQLRGLSEDSIRKMEAATFHGPHGVDAGLADQVGTLADAYAALVERVETGHRREGTTKLNTDPPKPAAENEEQDMATDKVVQLDENKLRAEAAAAERLRFKKIQGLCRLACRPDLAEGYVDQGLTLEQVQDALLELQVNVANTAGPIDNHLSDAAVRGIQVEPQADLAEAQQIAFHNLNNPKAPGARVAGAR